MRLVSGLDLAVAVFNLGIGCCAFATAANLWSIRNGGRLLRGICATLVAFTVWTCFVFAEVLHQMLAGSFVSSLNMAAADVDRLILSVPMGVLLLWIFPEVRHGIKPTEKKEN